jgi:hypothetical protein
MQLRVVVGLGEAGKHKVIRILEERARAKACWSKHGGVQRTRRLVGMCVGVRWLLVLLLRWRRRGRRWQVFSCFVNDAELDDGGWVDRTTIGCCLVRVNKSPKRKEEEGKVPPTPHILACLGCCLTWSSYSREASMDCSLGGTMLRGDGEGEGRT